MPDFCVVFDVDDTLYLERDYVRSGFAAVGRWLAEHKDAPGFGELGWRLFCEGVRGRTFNIALPQIGLPDSPELIRELVGVYRAHTPDISMLPDAAAAVAHTRDEGLAMGVVTDGPLASQEAKVHALGVDWIDPVMYTSRLGPGKGKPHPEAFRRIGEQHGLSGSRCVYLSDNPKKDFGGPKQLGWQTVRVRREGGLHAERPSKEDVDIEVTDLLAFATELLPILRQRAQR